MSNRSNYNLINHNFFTKSEILDKRNYNSRSKDKSKTTVGDKGKQSLKEIDDNSPIIKAFKEYATEIDERHDKYERLVKLSRDITIESKRIIFLLHNVDR